MPARCVALHLVGLGLYDVEDMTIKGLARLRACDVAYAEFYTAILAGSTHADLEAIAQKPVRVLDRLGVEKGGADLVREAKTRDVVLLTAGDPLAATTHADLQARCRAEGVACHVVHAPSIYSAAPGLVGLQHYKFGRTTTLVRPEKGWNPTSPFDAVRENHEAGLHTLVLLDIKTDEPSNGKGPGWPARGYFMTANEALAILLDLAERTGQDWFNSDAQVGVVCRAGSRDVGRHTGTVGELLTTDFGGPLHCVVIPGVMQVVEQEAWEALRAHP